LAAPLLSPLQTTGLSSTAEAERTSGSAIVTVAEVTQPFESVIVIVCKPAAKSVAEAEVEALLSHEREQGAFPPETETEAAPLLSPLQTTGLSSTAEAERTSGSAIVTVAEVTRPAECVAGVVRKPVATSGAQAEVGALLCLH